MGYIRHQSLLFTGDTDRINPFREQCLIIQSKVTSGMSRVSPNGWSVISEVIKSPLNGYSSFFIAPDGSKEGWSDSDLGDILIEKIKIEAKKHSIYMVHVSYGEGSDPCIVSDQNDDDLEY